jgi:hypothetical protein
MIALNLTRSGYVRTDQSDPIWTSLFGDRGGRHGQSANHQQYSPDLMADDTIASVIALHQPKRAGNGAQRARASRPRKRQKAKPVAWPDAESPSMSARDRECGNGVGKFCRERETTVAERRQILDAAVASVGKLDSACGTFETCAILRCRLQGVPGKADVVQSSPNRRF